MFFSLGVAGNAAAVVSLEAFSGRPFGVGRVTVDVTTTDPTLPLVDERFLAVESEGRVLYSILKEEPVRKIVRQLLNIGTPRKVTLFFLFRGDEPFDLQVYSPRLQVIRVVPNNAPGGHARVMDQWWNQQVGRWKRVIGDTEFPPVVDNFIVWNMARRLGRPTPDMPSSILPWKRYSDNVWQEMMATEQHRLKIDRELLEPSTGEEPRWVAMPEPLRFATPTGEPVAADPSGVEPMAAMVPEECFYLSFGTAENYFWFRDFQDRWDGDISSMLVRRPIRRNAAERIQQQLSLEETVFAKLLGPQVIRDVCLIGQDPYSAHGPGIGLVFQAKNNMMLSSDLVRQRRMAVVDPELKAKEERLQIAGHEATLVSTPDGRVRSYYAQAGDFHLVANSRSLVERFFECADGGRSLGTSPEYHDARRVLDDGVSTTVFVYVPSRFFENLCRPEVRIEADRRLRAEREGTVELMALLAAQQEGMQAESADDLIRLGMLPEGFGTRPDGSRWKVDGSGGVVDSLRGRSGCFLPVGDVPVERVTAVEAARYEAFKKRFLAEVGRMPPIAVAVTRAEQENHETVTARLFASPISGCKLFSFTSDLAEPNAQAIAPVAGDVAAFEASLDIDSRLWNPAGERHTLFGGLRDYRSPLAVRGGALQPQGGPVEWVRGYLGAWPRPGVLGLFMNDTVSAEPIPAHSEDLWQAIRDDVFLLSFKPDVIREVLPQLAVGPAERPAQVRVRVADLTGTDFSETVRALGYARTRQTCVAAPRLVNSAANQLGLDRATAMELAESVTDGTFHCPLGGEYVLVESPRELPMWTSTKLTPENRFLLQRVPEDFELPLLTWFHGLRGELLLENDQLHGRVEIDVAKSALPD